MKTNTFKIALLVVAYFSLSACDTAKSVHLEELKPDPAQEPYRLKASTTRSWSDVKTITLDSRCKNDIIKVSITTRKLAHEAFEIEVNQARLLLNQNQKSVDFANELLTSLTSEFMHKVQTVDEINMTCNPDEDYYALIIEGLTVPNTDWLDHYTFFFKIWGKENAYSISRGWFKPK